MGITGKTRVSSKMKADLKKEHIKSGFNELAFVRHFKWHLAYGKDRDVGGNKRTK